MNSNLVTKKHPSFISRDSSLTTIGSNNHKSPFHVKRQSSAQGVYVEVLKSFVPRKDTSIMGQVI